MGVGTGGRAGSPMWGCGDRNMTETDRTGQVEDRKQPREQILPCIITASRIRNFTEPRSSEDLSNNPAKPFVPREGGSSDR